MRSKRLFTSLSRGGLTQDASWTTRNKEWHSSTNQSFKQPKAGERLASSARHTRHASRARGMRSRAEDAKRFRTQFENAIDCENYNKGQWSGGDVLMGNHEGGRPWSSRRS